MPRLLVLLALAVGLVFGSAFAQDVDVGVESAEVRQAITVEIPERYALHLTRDAWVLDLNDAGGRHRLLPRPEGRRVQLRYVQRVPEGLVRGRARVGADRAVPGHDPRR
jgi:hypothetical protein